MNINGVGYYTYVKACSILSRRILNKNDIATADLLLLNFCRRYESLYGKEACTPNLHLHNHLKSCLLDYDPSHTFWCFSFERFNGVLGSFHTNRKAVETQIANEKIYLCTKLAECKKQSKFKHFDSHKTTRK